MCQKIRNREKKSELSIQQRRAAASLPVQQLIPFFKRKYLNEGVTGRMAETSPLRRE
jgi:hypothetical protein